MPEPTKAQLRTELIARRRALSPAELAAAQNAVADTVLALAAEQGWRRVTAYEAFRTEPSSPRLLRGLADAGVEIIVPITLPDFDLDWHRWPEPAEPLGVDAIAEVDAALVPALAVDFDGVRLGRGAGCYDRALARLPVERPVVALLHTGEVVERLPSEPWDRPVGEVVTPAGWRRVGNGR